MEDLYVQVYTDVHTKNKTYIAYITWYDNGNSNSRNNTSLVERSSSAVGCQTGN